MPKRTRSISFPTSDADLSDDTTDGEDLPAHVPKFSRISTSRSASPDPSAMSRSASHSPVSPPAQSQSQSIQCLLPPHPPLTFNSVSQFENHLYSHHTNRCSSCNNNFPSSHLLDLHQAEHHDPLVAARREKGEKTFACLVPGCEKVCEKRAKRRLHVVDKHGYRKDFDWAIVERGIDGRSSLLKKMGGMKLEAAGQKGQRGRKMSLTGGVGERGVKRSVGFQRSAMKRVGSEMLEEPSLRFEVGTDRTRDGREKDKEESSSDGDDADDLPVAPPVSASSRNISATSPSVNGAEDLVRGMSALRFVPPSVRRRPKTTAAVR